MKHTFIHMSQSSFFALSPPGLLLGPLIAHSSSQSNLYSACGQGHLSTCDSFLYSSSVHNQQLNAYFGPKNSGPGDQLMHNWCSIPYMSFSAIAEVTGEAQTKENYILLQVGSTGSQLGLLVRVLPSSCRLNAGF